MQPFPSRLGASQVRRGLSLGYTDHYSVYSGIVTHFGLSGTGPGTLTPRVGWGGAQNPSCVLLQVSNCLDLLDIYSNDVNEGNQDHVGSDSRDFGPPAQGGKIAFFAIVPKRGGRLFRHLRHLLRCVFTSFSTSSRLHPPLREM